MSCRRAFDLDLADFVAGSARPEWADFRAHYAGCPECAAEVHAWTELHLLLQAPGGHPAEELLLRFESEPGRLSAAERRGAEEHLARCPSCRDELAALRRFDFAALEPKAAATTAPAPRPSLVALLRRLVLHPAFAYAIVLLLLYPALEGRLRSPRQAPREDRQAVADRPAGTSAPAPEAAARQGPAEPAAQANLHDALTRARKEEAAPALRGKLQAAREGGAEPAPTAERLGDEQASIESESLAKTPRHAETPAATPEPAGRKTLALSGPGVPVDVTARDLGAGLMLMLPVPEAARTGAVEVRVLDAPGGREMRERFARPAERVAMRLPAVWLTPGTYTAELRRLDAEPSRVDVFPFRVVP